MAKYVFDSYSMEMLDNIIKFTLREMSGNFYYFKLEGRDDSRFSCTVDTLIRNYYKHRLLDSRNGKQVI